MRWGFHIHCNSELLELEFAACNFCRRKRVLPILTLIISITSHQITASRPFSCLPSPTSSRLSLDLLATTPVGKGIKPHDGHEAKFPGEQLHNFIRRTRNHVGTVDMNKSQHDKLEPLSPCTHTSVIFLDKSPVPKVNRETQYMKTCPHHWCNWPPCTTSIQLIGIRG